MNVHTRTWENSPDSSGFTPGDVLVRRAANKIAGMAIRHYGIYVGNERVIHASYDEKKITDEVLTDFAAGEELKRSDDVEHLSINRHHVLCRAFRAIGYPYKLTKQNCEHFVYWCATGIPKSPTVTKFLTASGILALGGIYFITSGKE